MTKIITISETITLDYPAELVWHYVEDYSNDLAWRAGLSEMTPSPIGPPRIGTRVHEVVRKMGSTYVTDSTVTEIGPGRRYRFVGSGDSGTVKGGRAVVETPAGSSEFTYDIELHLIGFNAFLAPIVRRVMTSGLRRDLRSLRSVLAETNAATEAA